jgi:peptidoglycan/LPS O-acetylase OafA/YrhL
MQNNKHIYRPDIDGLRAIAVISVVIFHAFPKALPGGFVGVDIFFVISGYLITQIITENLRNGTFTFADFYSRRIRRIFPALLIVLACCLLSGWFMLLADEYKQLGKHTLGGAASVANLVLWSESGYFDNASITKPLLHLWSLGVEEQFYLAWPFILYAMWRLKAKAIYAAVALAGMSFCFSIYQSYHLPVAAFYSPLTRTWELMAGAILAMLSADGKGIMSRAVATVTSGAGALMVLTGLFITREGMPFPGWIGILPVGAALIIAGSNAPPNRILSARPLVFVGLISYPLYLWHWPLLSFATIIEGQVPNHTVRALAVVAAFVLAYATYLYIERPVRLSQDKKRSAILLFTCMAIVAAAGAVIYLSGGATSRPIAKATTAFSEAKTDWDYEPTKLENGQITGIHKSDGRSDDVVLFIGDSLMSQYFPRVKALYQDEDHTPRYSTWYASRNQCRPWPGTGLRSGPENINCDDYYTAAIQLAHADKVKRVVLAGNWTSALSQYARSENVEQFVADLRQLKHLGKEVVIIGMPPRSQLFSPASAAKPFRNPWGSHEAPDTYVQQAAIGKLDADYGAKLHDIAEQAAARIVDPYPVLCPNRLCPVLVNGAPIYSDGTHLRASFVRRNAVFMDELVN